MVSATATRPKGPVFGFAVPGLGFRGSDPVTRQKFRVSGVGPALHLTVIPRALHQTVIPGRASFRCRPQQPALEGPALRRKPRTDGRSTRAHSPSRLRKFSCQVWGLGPRCRAQALHLTAWLQYARERAHSPSPLRKLWRKHRFVSAPGCLGCSPDIRCRANMAHIR